MPQQTESSRKQDIGIGIIGTGLMGGIHAECLNKETGGRLVAYYNRTRQKAVDLAGKYGGKVFDTWQALVAAEEVDAVIVASPQAFHAEQIVAAARAGKHVFAEKPLALTVPELDAVDKSVRDSGVRLMVGHQLRFHPVIEAVQAALPKLGRVYHLDLEWSLRIDGHTGRCWENYRLGGFFMELGCHACDLSRFLMGPIKHVTGYTLRLNPRRVTEDYANCLLKFGNEAVGQILVSANHRTKRQGLIMGRVIGARGRIDFSLYPYSRAFNQAVMVLDKGTSVFVPDTKREKLHVAKPASLTRAYPGFFDVYQREARDFLQSIRTGNAPRCTLADGRSAVEVVLALYHEQGKITRAPNFETPSSRYRSDANSHPLLTTG